MLFSVRTTRRPYSYIASIEDDGNIHVSMDQFEAMRLTVEEWRFLTESVGGLRPNMWINFPALSDDAIEGELYKRGRQ